MSTEINAALEAVHKSRADPRNLKFVEEIKGRDPSVRSAYDAFESAYLKKCVSNFLFSPNEQNTRAEFARWAMGLSHSTERDLERYKSHLVGKELYAWVKALQSQHERLTK